MLGSWILAAAALLIFAAMTLALQWYGRRAAAAERALATALAQLQQQKQQEQSHSEDGTKEQQETALAKARPAPVVLQHAAATKVSRSKEPLSPSEPGTPATPGVRASQGGSTGGALALRNMPSMSWSTAGWEVKPAFSDLPENTGKIQVLSVDDEEVNNMVMRSVLQASAAFVVESLNTGEQLLAYLEDKPLLPDVILLDVSLPGLSGFEAAAKIREQWSAVQLPIIMVTGSTSESDIVNGLQAGANNYMTKPCRFPELKARISTQVALRRSFRVATDASRNTTLLRSILPPNIIAQLKRGAQLIANYHDSCTILFSDIKGFTDMSAKWPTEEIILMLNELFTEFDHLCDLHGVFKVETIGDAYMIASGHDGRPDHAVRMLRVAAEMVAAAAQVEGFDGEPIQIRVGVHTGPCHSGVVGECRPRYCFFGDTVNTASRMESFGYPGAVHVSDQTREEVQRWMEECESEDGDGSAPEFAPCGERAIKGKGIMKTWLLKAGTWCEALEHITTTATVGGGDGATPLLQRQASHQHGQLALMLQSWCLNSYDDVHSGGGASGQGAPPPPPRRSGASALLTSWDEEGLFVADKSDVADTTSTVACGASLTLATEEITSGASAFSLRAYGHASGEDAPLRQGTLGALPPCCPVGKVPPRRICSDVSPLRGCSEPPRAGAPAPDAAQSAARSAGADVARTRGVRRNATFSVLQPKGSMPPAAIRPHASEVVAPAPAPMLGQAPSRRLASRRSSMLMIGTAPSHSPRSPFVGGKAHVDGGGSGSLGATKPLDLLDLCNQLMMDTWATDDAKPETHMLAPVDRSKSATCMSYRRTASQPDL